MKILKADESKLCTIIKLAESYSTDMSDNGFLAEKGFLISNFSLSVYEEYLKTSDHFYILLKGNELIGFMLAYSADKIKADEELNSYIKEMNPKPFILIKQICIRQDYTGKGYAKKMYEHLFRSTEKTDFFAAIVLKPFNEVSVRFHESAGFIKQFEYKPSDGILRGVWKRN